MTSNLRYTFFIVAVMILSDLVVGQIDEAELEQKLGSAQGTDRIDVLIQLAHANRGTNATKSLDFGKRALGLAEELNDRQGIADANRVLSFFFEENGDVPAAFSHFQRYTVVREALLNSRIQNLENKLRLVHESQSVEHRIELLKKDMQIRELTLKRRILMQNALFALLVPLALLLFVLNRLNRAKAQIKTETKKRDRDLDTANKKMEHLMMKDQLTSLPNRRYVWDKMIYERRRFKRTQRPFALVFADVDGFEKANSVHGRDGGDFLLKSISRVISSVIREQDTLSRWGGEEFLLLLPETDLRGGLEMAERVRLEIEFRNFEYQNKNLSVTMTFGVSVFQEDEDLETMLKRAEKAMLQGKQAGKNCVMPSSTRSHAGPV